MALDTVGKRFSALNSMCPWRGILPIPDGTIEQGDRQTFALLCSSVLAGEPVVPVVPVATNDPDGWYPWEIQPGDDRRKKSRRKKRAADLKKLDDLISSLLEEVPHDVPEAQPVKVAAKAVERAIEVARAPQAPIAAIEAVDLAPLRQSIAEAKQAIADYKTRKEYEAIEQDDEDILLLLTH
jgi:hypothetical protein